MNDKNEDQEMCSAAERHHQIMIEMESFFRRLVFSIICLVVVLAAIALMVFIGNQKP